jgi:hypothetical protein
LGVLQCTINYAAVEDAERINFVGISGKDGRGTHQCLLQVQRLIKDHHKAVAAILRDSSIYGPLEGTMVEWAPGFLAEIGVRLPRYFRALLNHLQNVDFNNTNELKVALRSYHEHDAMFSRLAIGENLDIYVGFVRKIHLDEQNVVQQLLLSLSSSPVCSLLRNWYDGNRAILQNRLYSLAQVPVANLMRAAKNMAKTEHGVLDTPENLVSQDVKDSVVNLAATLMAAVNPA